MKTDITVEQVVHLFRTSPDREKFAWWLFAMMDFRKKANRTLANKISDEFVPFVLSHEEEGLKALNSKPLAETYFETYSLIE